MRIPLWLIALLFVGYTVWCVRYWHCRQCDCCNGEPATQTVQTSGVPLFKWNADQPEPDANFKAWKKDLVARSGQGDTLLITAWYRAGETNASKAANLGQARAEALRSLMQPEVPESRIHLAFKTVEDSLAEGGPARESADFSWLKMVLKKDEGAIIESDNAVTFLFPFNSTEKDQDPKVDAYLLKLVAKHKSTASTFTIVGHTDDVGEPAENIKLGLGRANAIARILINNGIDTKRIKVDSKGEAQPVADNGTEDGRHQNRRVVITTAN
ncbi:MAG: OmpA family protein [Saprospiraceae bacterium]|nr:OmpA family protein [Saprospiraceae bacterium]